MNDFLNKYMGWNRELKHQSVDQIEHVFVKTIEIVNWSLGRVAFRPRAGFNAAVFDSVMIGLARRIEKGDIKSKEKLIERYNSLLKDEKFVIATEESTSNEDRVKERIARATDVFADVP
jgi:hypothetical protein